MRRFPAPVTGSLVAAMLLSATASAQPGDTDRRGPITGRTATPQALAAPAALSGIEQLLAVLDTQIAQSPPRRMSRAERATWDEQTAWLRSVRNRYAAHARATAQGAATTGSQFVALHSTVQREIVQRERGALDLASYQADSTTTAVMRTRHDTAKNAISNMR